MAAAFAAFPFVCALGAFRAEQTPTQPESSIPAAIPKNLSQQLSPKGALQLHSLLTSMEAADEKANSPDTYAREALQFYSALNDSLPWISAAHPTVQAHQIIEELKHADEKGLRPEDYAGPLWDKRLAALAGGMPPEAALIPFDVQLTLSTMLFLSDLHVGRVNPRALRFAFTSDEKSLDLSEFLRHELVNANDVQAVVDSVEPQFLAYRRTLHALHGYRELARNDQGGKLPPSQNTVHPGEPYSGLPLLARRLRLLGDLAESNATNPATYGRELVGAVKHFQRRHGLAPSGDIDGPTFAQLNTPISHRVLQLQLTLERWRWLPQNFTRPPIVVNIPEFRLYAITENHRVAFAMNIVVGRAYQHETPVFTSEIESVIFRPYWNVPLVIQRDELVPQLNKHPNYLEENSYEIVDARGRVVGDSDNTQEIEERLRSGAWLLRQMPGPANSLGLVKFELPNPYDVYLHGTPEQELFFQSRRDFSHGCIRVEDPAALARWILRGNPGWTDERIRAAMNGDQSLRVSLEQPVPAWILYGTAVVQEDGEVHFLEDIYEHDAALERVLGQRNSGSVR
jgi:murein L,D-transpeptidase YcbB/YkuD